MAYRLSEVDLRNLVYVRLKIFLSQKMESLSREREGCLLERRFDHCIRD